MDSRGCYDALVTNESLGTSIDDARASIDMIAVQQGTAPETLCHPTWVPSDLNLANSLTKCSTEAYRAEMALFHTKKSWIVRFNNEFISARKAQRLRRTKQLAEQKNHLHFCDIPEIWDDSWALLFGVLPERKDLE